MATPSRTDPPYVPLRHSRWPSHRAPRWLLLAGVIVLASAVLVGWAVRPTRAQRAADMNSFLADVTTDVQSCAGGVRESLFALHQIDSGATRDTQTALRIATTGATNCEPANNTQIEDLMQYQVHESLARFHLSVAVKDLSVWAVIDAARVMNDVAQILSAHGTAQAAARAKLRQDLRVLDAQRAKVYRGIRPAMTRTGATGKLPVLPG